MIEVKKESGKLKVTIDNGHEKALKKIVTDYNLKGEKEALGFMLSVVSEGQGKSIEVNGTSYIPSDSISNSPIIGF